MKTVAFITIKLQSQRLKNKNILPLNGKPLCWHIHNTLLQCKAIDEIYVYCSEERVMEYLPDGVIFKQREKYLDGDLIRAKDTYEAFVNDVDADLYVAALTTAPFIKPESIDHGVLAVQSGQYDSAFSAQKIQTFAWYNGQPINYDPKDVPRTQDMEPVFVETSGFFAFPKALWTQHKRRIGFKPYIQMVDDIEAIDIDTEDDYNFAKIVSAGKACGRI